MILVHFFTETSACGGFPTSKIYKNFQPSSPYNIINLILNFVHRKMHVQMDIIGWLFILKDNFFLISIVLVPILRWTRKDAPRCIWVLFMNRKTYDLRCFFTLTAVFVVVSHNMWKSPINKVRNHLVLLSI